jgi:hypothetical protein
LGCTDLNESLGVVGDTQHTHAHPPTTQHKTYNLLHTNSTHSAQNIQFAAYQHTPYHTRRLTKTRMTRN